MMTPDLSVYFAVWIRLHFPPIFVWNFRLGVVNAPIPGWDFLLPWGIFSRISISKFPDKLPLHSASNCRFTCMQ